MMEYLYVAVAEQRSPRGVAVWTTVISTRDGSAGAQPGGQPTVGFLMETSGGWLGTPEHARWLERETDALLRFATRARTTTGFGYLGGDGRVVEGQPWELWITCRMTHSFALGHLLGRPGAGPLVDHGLGALDGAFADERFGGWHSRITPEGDPAGGKDAYSHAFVLLATASAVAAGRPRAQELFERARRVSVERFWREDEGMVVERYDRTFTDCEGYRGVNANMHTVEAYLATADVTGDDAWLTRALRILERVLDGFAASSSWRVPEHFDNRWRPLPDYNRDRPADPFRPFGTTVGHSLEWARLALHAWAAVGERGGAAHDGLLRGARELFRQATSDGWAVDGREGFVYTVDHCGSPVVHERMHWVVCEAVSAAAALHRATGEAAYEQWYRTWWDFAAEHLIEAPGVWRHELDQHNQPSEKTWQGKPDIYHALQATLIPRLPLAPALAPALARGHLDSTAPVMTSTTNRRESHV